ncbi:MULTISPECIES: helix-turn-helix transcriptional regulator [unclassified Streptomyces]|uniref:helix-turn-helix domain-containing protein n=1 Tax=unclassified Streptomyces TaxID=2593676 RepID=UPI0023672A5B|nr:MULTISPECIES: helix-turn-helix transcriptional regulator [unclassified Streptomyces]MDF3144374.1 helix-turn-helix transcriptional regulator [Streptomyces sp. T21Q-yed]WDF38690.1 helix-turn-helix transcriptional regulator [Streptomyces sp. T12]
MAIEDNPRSREQYGAELKRRREAAGLTQEELSQRAVMSRTHIAHIEGGRRRPDPDDARRLDQVLDAGGFFVNFLPTLDGKKVAEHFKEALEFEGKATIVKEYAPNLVPGLLQTKAYAYEVLGTGYPRPSDEERDKLVSTRLERARILDTFHSPEACFLIDEAVLRRVVGGPGVMCEQLRHIAELGASRRIRVHVLPYSVGAHALQAGFLSLMWFDDQPPIAYAEGVNSGRVLELPSAVRACQELYDQALGDALSHRKSLDLLRSVAEDYEHEEQRADHP